MKKVKALCIGVSIALGVAFAPNLTFANVQAPTATVQVQAATAKTYTVDSSQGNNGLKNALAKAKSGDTIEINGAIKSVEVTVPAGVTIKGINGGKVDFSPSASGKRGFTVKTDNVTIQDLQIYNAKDNGIYMEGSHNNLTNLNVHDNGDAGVQLSNGASYDTLTKVHSHHNVDRPTNGENADGFAIKLHSGEGIVLDRCVSNDNSDDGYDCYATHGAITFKNCQANNNGECYGVKGDGNGFKLGGVDNKTSGVAAHLDPNNHVLTGCSAVGNSASGFDRNNQMGVVTMTNCTADSNGKNNFNWPAKGTPSALGYQVTFGKAKIVSCTSKNGTNNISGATLSGNCIGF